jgi:hypothetical protein
VSVFFRKILALKPAITQLRVSDDQSFLFEMWRFYKEDIFLSISKKNSQFLVIFSEKYVELPARWATP